MLYPQFYEFQMTPTVNGPTTCYLYYTQASSQISVG